MNADGQFLRLPWLGGTAPQVEPTAARGESVIETCDGVVVSGDTKRCLFLFQVRRWGAGRAEELLCGFSANFHLPPGLLARLMSPGRRLYLTGYPVTPSVYKPFRFEVVSVEEHR